MTPLNPRRIIMGSDGRKAPRPGCLSAYVDSAGSHPSDTVTVNHVRCAFKAHLRYIRSMYCKLWSIYPPFLLHPFPLPSFSVPLSVVQLVLFKYDFKCAAYV